VGGYEIAGIAGVILGAAYKKVPVLVDGFISTAGALIAKGLCPACLDYMIPSHQSQEPGHQMMWTALGLRPLLNLDFRLGEGTGAAVAMHLVESSARIMNELLTFEDAGVTNGHEQ
jgi:nicotinate-nucleotide--dimethylbenzimidazole phosphoribosyltransferase